MTVVSVDHINDKYVLVKLTHDTPLPSMRPGQFVEVKVEGSPNTFLRRPISINNVDTETNELHLLVAAIGDGTRRIAALKSGEKLNVMLPLGNGFTMPTSADDKPLLVGGGVGVAPLLFMGKAIRQMGSMPTFLLGARSGKDLLLIDEFEKVGRVFITTEDGTAGEQGYVTSHTLLQKETFTFISTCGPKPMMMAVARYAEKANTECEVSLENMMACGLGACLCCVEKTRDAGHVCVCTEGPVINAKRLEW